MNDTDSYWEIKNYVTFTEVLFSFIFYCTLSCIIVLGNMLLITAYKNNWRIRTVTNTLVLGLAVADLLVGMVSIPFWLYVYSCPYFESKLDEIAYDIYITVDIFVSSASILQLTAISIERCIAIVWPIKHRAMKENKFHLMIVVSWGLAAFIASLYPVQLKHWEQTYSILVFITCFFIPFAIMIIVYTSIYFTVTRSRTRVCPNGICSTINRGVRVSSTVALVTGIFIFAWTPFFVVTVVATYNIQVLPEPPRLFRLVAVVKALHYANSGMDPFVYGYRNNEMRKAMKNVLLKYVCIKMEQENRPKTMRTTQSMRLAANAAQDMDTKQQV